MSSGYYELLPPPKPSRLEILNAQLDELNAYDSKMREHFARISAEMEEIGAILTFSDFEYHENACVLGADSVEAETSVSGFDVSDLVFTEIDPETSQVTIVVLDFSDMIATSHARNSTQFKKMSFASEAVKKLVQMPLFTDEDRKSREKLIDFINRLMYDDTVTYQTFFERVSERMTALQQHSQVRYTNMNLWKRYCALCALCGKFPQKLPESALPQAIEELFNERLRKTYMDGARQALTESMNELGLTVEGDYVLDDISGTLISDSDSQGIGLFVSEAGHEFVMEVVDGEEWDSTEEYINKRRSLCSKRKQLEDLMAKKGYTLRLVMENDEITIPTADVQQSKTKKDSKAERIRKKCAINGKTPKHKYIGG